MEGYVESQIAVHFWYDARKENVDRRVSKLLPFVFYTLDSLYEVTQKLPDRSRTHDNVPIINATNFFVIGLPDSNYYHNIRLTLALVSDLYFLLEGVLNLGELMEIQSIISQMDAEARKFDDIRNFFTHLDTRITKLNEHGIDGTVNTSCGIRYANAKECFHLVVGQGEIHFSDKKVAKEIDVSKSAFDPIFEEARRLFAELCNNRLENGRKTFPRPESIYPP
jgi:hypothetical protein